MARYCDGVGETVRREFAVSVRGDGPTVTVIVRGEVDIANARELYATIDNGHSRAATSVLVDLRGVTFLDSTGLRALLTANDELDGRLRVVPSAACLRLFDIAGVTERLVGAYSGVAVQRPRDRRAARPA